MANQEMTALAVVEMARTGRFSEIEELFAPRLKAVVSAETLGAAWASEVRTQGSVSSVGQPLTEAIDAGLLRVRVPVTCVHGGLTVVMSVDDAGRLHGLRLAPSSDASWSTPPYARPSSFVEQEVTIGSDALAVPGTLTMPQRRGRRPGVVLLSGGGPFDRDETSGPNKPLKDLAWGLASRNVAVLRFDKVTYVHRAKVAAATDFTMTQEYVPHALAAVRLLQDQATVDPDRVFVLGHSMGGRVAPRIANADPSVAGLVIMAGDAEPMQQSAVRVARYLASLSPDPAADAAMLMISQQAAVVESDDLSPLTPARELPFGFPASYWLDLRADDPVATAAALDRPMFILQGGRDYQVTAEGDLARWKKGLAHRPDVTIRVYDAANHLFFPGEGPSTPAEYGIAQHVDSRVVADIADWLMSDRGRLAAVRSRLERALRH